MVLVRLSGHSGAGKSRLLAALPGYGLRCRRAVLYTSRVPREQEIHGKDYYFATHSAINAFPRKDFLVGPVRTMLQAVDLVQLQLDLEETGLVLIEIFHGLWPSLRGAMTERMGGHLATTSVFMSAVDPSKIRQLPPDAAGRFIEDQVAKFLHARGTDDEAEIAKRSKSAIHEVLEATGENSQSARLFHSSPEGPEGEDDWTRAGRPVGRARAVREEFGDLLRSVDPASA
jgi:hypothetical protein